MRRPLEFAVTAFVMAILPAVAAAQPAARHGGIFLYGISFGAARQTASGTLHAPEIPPAAGQPPSKQTVFALDLSGGVTLGRYVGLLALFEQSGGATTPTGRWGALGFHGVARAWVTSRVWIEGGGGTIQLGYRLPSASGSYGVTRLWAPGPEVGAGVEVFQGAHVAIGVMARYTTAKPEDLKIERFSLQVELLARE